jgi:hypothetical protein
MDARSRADQASCARRTGKHTCGKASVSVFNMLRMIKRQILLSSGTSRQDLTMRILHLLNHTNRLNGHVHAAVDLACAQIKLGHSVAVASGGGDFDALLAANNIETMLVSHERRPATLLKC